MKHDIRKYLYDIKTSIDSINGYLNEQLGERRDFFAYQSNKLLRRGVERELEIIGEAMNQILKVEPDIDIKDARKIVNTRNWVIHAYDNVDDVIVWGIIINHLPRLQKDVEKLLAES